MREDSIESIFRQLHDLAELVRAAGYAVDILVVIHLLHAAAHVFAVFDDGQRHIRL